MRHSREETEEILREYLPKAVDKGFVSIEADCKHIGSTTGESERTALGVLLVLNTESKRSELLIGYEPLSDKRDEACARIVYEIFEDLGIESMKQKVGCITDAGQGKILNVY